MNLTAKPYEVLRQRCLPKILSLREPADFHDPIPISERLVQTIWFDQLFETHHLKTRDGNPIQIIHAGRWNTEGGPDFKGAQLNIAGKLACGDVEIHLHTTGWKEHRHDLDPAYRQVILDVCLWDFGDGKMPSVYHGQMIPQLILYPYLQCSLDELVESIDIDRYPFSPTRVHTHPSLFSKIPKEKISDYLQSAGLFRFEQKSLRITEHLARLDPDQTAYQILAEALGYKHNKLAFRQVAIGWPLSALVKLPLDQKIQSLIAIAEKQRLKLSQVRPANHPHRRLATLALLTEEQPQLSRWFSHLMDHPKKFITPPKLHHPFWSYHYHLQGKCLSNPLALLGRGRWLEILTNVILPFCYAEAQRQKKYTMTQQIIQQYHALPASSPNLASRQIAYNLGLKPPAKAVEQQGLIQMYQDFDLLNPAIP